MRGASLRNDSVRYRLTILVAVTIWLAGCARGPEPVVVPVPVDPTLSPLAPVNDARLRDIADSFEMRGKLAAAVDGRGYNARLRWAQHTTTFNIMLSGPVGIGQTEVFGHPGVARVRQSSGEQIYDDPAEAMSAAFGFRAPLSELRFWIVGVPAPGPGFTEHAPPAEASRLFEQSGWRVLVRELTQTSAGVLPRRVVLTRDDTRLRLVISHWQSPAPRPDDLASRGAIGR